MGGISPGKIEMKWFAYRYPLAFSLINFVVVQIVGTLLGIVCGVLLINLECKPQGPNDPCDGPAMMMIIIGYVSIIVGFFAGLIVCIFTYVYFNSRSECEERIGTES